MIPQKAIKQFSKPSHREIGVGHMLSYGFFLSDDRGREEAKKFVDSLDQWVAPSQLPNYYDGIESDLLTGKETAGIINIRNILDEFYFGDDPTVEEIPVEVEVVEVEQKTVDEPIKVVIEAPFEPPVSAPKRLRLRKRSGLVYPKPKKKKSAAERMAEAFDERLDELVDSIKNPPEPAQPRPSSAGAGRRNQCGSSSPRRAPTCAPGQQ